jgi:hypothetical protein
MGGSTGIIELVQADLLTPVRDTHVGPVAFVSKTAPLALHGGVFGQFTTQLKAHRIELFLQACVTPVMASEKLYRQDLYHYHYHYHCSQRH